MLKFLTYYAHVKKLCLNFDCFIRVYSFLYIRVAISKVLHITVVQIVGILILNHIFSQALSVLLCLMLLATHYTQNYAGWSLKIIGHKFGENNAGIIGCLQAYNKGTNYKMGKCNEI